MTTETKASIEPNWLGAVPSWTPASAKRAYVDCQSGNLAAAAQLCDSIRTDSKIRGVLETRKNALFGCELDFEPAGHKSRSTPICRALKDDGEFWAMAPESALSQIFIWGLLLNIGLGELTWRYDDTITEAEAPNVVSRDGKWVQLLTPKHPRNLRWDDFKKRWMLTVADASEIEVTPGDGRWLMYTPFGENSPWMHGLYWGLALLWLSKSYSDFDWGRRNEGRGAASALFGTTPEGSKDEDRQAFAQDLAGLRRKLALAAAPGYSVTAVNLGVDDHETFKARIDWADGGIALLVLGQNLGGDSAKASALAAPKTNDKVRQDYLEFDAESYASCLQGHMLRPYSNVRYGNPDLAPWPKWKTEPPEDIVQAATTTDKAVTALVNAINGRINVDVEAYCARFKIPLIKGGPALLPAPEPVAPPPAKNIPPAEG